MHTTQTTRLLSLISLLAVTSSPLSAFDFKGLQDEATAAAIPSMGGSADYLSLGKQLMDGFSGNELAQKYGKGLLGSMGAGKYTDAFGYYDKIKAAGLTPDQMDVWNGVKNQLSAVMLEGGLSGVDSDLVGKAADSLNANDVSGASHYLSKLPSAAKLTSGQSSLIQHVKGNLLPIPGGTK